MALVWMLITEQKIAFNLLLLSIKDLSQRMLQYASYISGNQYLLKSVQKGTLPKPRLTPLCLAVELITKSRQSPP